MVNVVSNITNTEQIDDFFSNLDIDQTNLLSYYLFDPIVIYGVEQTLSSTDNFAEAILTSGDKVSIYGTNLAEDNSDPYSFTRYEYTTTPRSKYNPHEISFSAVGNLVFTPASLTSQSGYFTEMTVTTDESGRSISYLYKGLFSDRNDDYTITSINISNALFNIDISGNLYTDDYTYTTKGTINEITISTTSETVSYSGLTLDVAKFSEANSYVDLREILLNGNDLVTGGQAFDHLVAGAGHDIIQAYAGDDTIYGNAGNDLIDGGVGADIMYGGAGDDTYYVDHQSDQVIEKSLIDYQIVSLNEQLEHAYIQDDYVLSNNGHYIAYLTIDLYGQRALFVQNTINNQIKSVPVNLNDNILEYTATVSNDGRFMVFDPREEPDVNIVDLETGVIGVVSIGSNNSEPVYTRDSQLSNDGRYVLFKSSASLVENDLNEAGDLYLKDLLTGSIQRVSTDENNNELPYILHTPNSMENIDGVLSGNGQYVVFVTKTDSYSDPRVFIKNVETGSLALVDIKDDGQVGQNILNIFTPKDVTVSDDGRYVAFISDRDYLEKGLNEGQAFFKDQIYLKDLQTGKLSLVSSNDSGQPASTNIRSYSMSDDGRFIIFDTFATNLTTNSNFDANKLFIKDLHTGELKLMGDPDFFTPLNDMQISPDGKHIYLKNVWNYSLVYKISNPFLFDQGTIEGVDTVVTALDYELPNAVENLTLIGNAPLQLVGTDFDNTLIGNTADNVLVGGLGNDVIDGGAGADTAVLNALQSDILYTRPAKKGGVVIATPDGIDRLKSIETISFRDGNMTPENLLNAYQLNQPSFQKTGGSIKPDIYEGPVSYLQYQLFGDGENDVVLGDTTNDFINLFGGDDAADGGEGDDVLDGGTGSNFLSGGQGDDTFFIDGRGQTITWSTMTDFDGDEVNIWGWLKGVSKLIATDESGGATGYTGATYHYDLNNDGTIDTSITLTGLELVGAFNISEQEVNGQGYLLIS